MPSMPSMRIVGIHTEPDSRSRNHQHIAKLKYRGDGTASDKVESKDNMIKLLLSPILNNHAYVQDSIGRISVKIIYANPPYLRTKKDGRETDNLLDLPRF